MKHLKKLVMLVLVTITMFSCRSTITNCDDCDNNGDDIIWELAGNLPYLNINNWYITITSNGDIWAHQSDELYLSTNNGDTWVQKNNTPFIGGLITASPVDGCFFAIQDFNRLYRSTDNCKSWKIFMDSIMIGGILFVSSGEIYIGCQKLYAGGEYFCYYSNDNGNTWIEKSNVLPDGFGFSLLTLGKDGTLYAGSNSGVYRSTDSGVTWLPSANYNNVRVHWLTICDDGLIFATTNNAVIKSTDKGVTWNKVNTGFDANHINEIVYNPVTKDIFVTSVFDNYRYEVYKSSNLGESWKLENSGLPNARHYNLVFNSNTGQMFIETIAGVYRTKNYPK